MSKRSVFPMVIYSRSNNQIPKQISNYPNTHNICGFPMIFEDDEGDDEEENEEDLKLSESNEPKHRVNSPS
ncbi:hypothetical protein HanXRQr2_Chr16g0747851 [Helianthus annuus]|uniref:Uncharacterized protein n=1 Tax=Helianthus annuus TaxID=4232 RepID=A0A9K3GY47_HELAN|nr:hypothetical protein HanXRQr2_Chr16g0747851 [Helianthus annuus]KAJ0821175.1 hypothetical protein HanPSC8_Chr16g0716931 [Helianthus annuus]